MILSSYPKLPDVYSQIILLFENNPLARCSWLPNNYILFCHFFSPPLERQRKSMRASLLCEMITNSFGAAVIRDFPPPPSLSISDEGRSEGRNCQGHHSMPPDEREGIGSAPREVSSKVFSDTDQIRDLGSKSCDLRRSDGGEVTRLSVCGDCGSFTSNLGLLSKCFSERLAIGNFAMCVCFYLHFSCSC